MKTIDLSKDFSRHPAGRYRSDGPYTGEQFREEFLEPSLGKNEYVIVELDGARGYGSSFLEEAFGGLVRAGYSIDTIIRLIELRSSNPLLIHQIQKYIRDGEKKRDVRKYD
jgi:hypothetical protein